MQNRLSLKAFMTRNFSAITIFIIVGILVSFSIAGLSLGEFLEFLTVAVVLVSVITDISIIVAVIMNSGLKHMKILWLGISIIFFAISGFVYLISNNIKDFHVVLGWELNILSFPISLAINYLAYIFSRFIEMDFIGLIMTWSLYIVPGYFQWFILLPFIVKKVQRKDPTMV